MDFKQLKKYIHDMKFIENAEDAIDHLLSISQKDDSISIIGTHFWGEIIEKKFNISFDNL